MSTYRTGGHWGVTIIQEGVQVVDAAGRRSDDRLVAVVLDGDRALAERICARLNDGDCMAVTPPLIGDHACRCVRGTVEHWEHRCRCGATFWERP